MFIAAYELMAKKHGIYLSATVNSASLKYYLELRKIQSQSCFRKVTLIDLRGREKLVRKLTLVWVKGF